MDIGSLVASHRSNNRTVFTFDEIEASAAARSAWWASVTGAARRFARWIARARPARDGLASRMPAE
ncbi:MAG: hypothetical protein KDK53_22320 [Maritimibacter sp.]|nr:hypothetical protein [Maritimibacter sp.]